MLRDLIVNVVFDRKSASSPRLTRSALSPDIRIGAVAWRMRLPPTVPARRSSNAMMPLHERERRGRDTFLSSATWCRYSSRTLFVWPARSVNLFQILSNFQRRPGSPWASWSWRVWRVISVGCGSPDAGHDIFPACPHHRQSSTRLPIYSFGTEMVKPEGDIAVPHYRCGASFFHLMAYGGEAGGGSGFNLFKLFLSGLGTPVILLPVEGRERFDGPHSRDSSEVEYKTPRCLRA